MRILNLLHDTHVGVCRMKAAPRMYLWWPNIDKDIEEYARGCEPCQLNQSSPSETQLSKWPETTSCSGEYIWIFSFGINKCFCWSLTRIHGGSM